MYLNDLIAAIMKEFEAYRVYLAGEAIESIYFGGGTPSLLPGHDIDMLLQKIYKYFPIADNPEITFESNPDDLSYSYLKSLLNIGINRLSIGVQSFLDEDLKILNRCHSSKQSITCINTAQHAGFENISIDLIYGLPQFAGSIRGNPITKSPDKSLYNWSQNLETSLKMNIQHISAYHLNIEPATVFYKYLNQGKLVVPDEEFSYRQFEMLIEYTGNNDFVQYEISNFGKHGYFSVHNSNYWKNRKYLGVGPSAHSYDGTSRQWNISNTIKYIDGINKGVIPCERELLDNNARFNDYIMTSLRTMWGIDLSFISNEFGTQNSDNLLKSYEPYILSGHARTENNFLILTTPGKFISDRIISDLFLV